MSQLFLGQDRVSRHEVPTTPGKKTLFKMHDPARVSHLLVRQSVRHPGGVAGIEPHRNPESSGLRPSTTWLKSGHPCRGALYSTFLNELSVFYKFKCVTPDYASLPEGDQWVWGSTVSLHGDDGISGLALGPSISGGFLLPVLVISFTGISDL